MNRLLQSFLTMHLNTFNLSTMIGAITLISIVRVLPLSLVAVAIAFVFYAMTIAFCLVSARGMNDEHAVRTSSSQT